MRDACFCASKSSLNPVQQNEVLALGLLYGSGKLFTLLFGGVHGADLREAFDIGRGTRQT